MNQSQDDRIVELLRADAPSVRDPIFRMQVLERRERRQFQRRAFTLLAAQLVLVLVLTFTMIIGEGMSLVAADALASGTALAGGYFAFRGQLLRILRRLTL